MPSLVAVRDSGPGIDLKHFERVFEAFYTHRNWNGACRSAGLSSMPIGAGCVWAHVNEPRGAVFRFALPSAQGN
jgi:K+-sensing histidine kinase KdpD